MVESGDAFMGRAYVDLQTQCSCLQSSTTITEVSPKMFGPTKFYVL